MAHSNYLNLLAEHGRTGMLNVVKNERSRDTLDELGVLEAIRRLAAAFEKRSGIACEPYLHVDSSRLRHDVSNMLFRIVQETLTHVVTHSFATQVEIYLEDIDNALFIGINDNGTEIQVPKPGSSKSLGIADLRERVRHLNGKFDIQRKEKGTMVSILIPVEGELFYQGNGR